MTTCPDVTYPYLDQTNHRNVPADYTGDVLVWDIDKTYLDTRFSSLRGLLSIPFEAAIDKRALPGTVPLLRALRRGALDQNAFVPLYFVSGSPLQLRSVIERKMMLDGVDFDGITFKDQWGLLRHGRPRAIAEQVGYKLIALLSYRLSFSDHARWWLFGDDVERDGVVFSLFGEVCAGLRGTALQQRLQQLHVMKPERQVVCALAERLPGCAPNPIGHIFIHLARRSSPERFSRAQMSATFSFAQTALLLLQMNRIRVEGARAVIADIRRKHTPEAELQRHLEDAVKRLSVPHALVDAVATR